MVNQGNALVSKGDEDMPISMMDLTAQDWFPTTVYSGIPGSSHVLNFKGRRKQLTYNVWKLYPR